MSNLLEKYKPYLPQIRRFCRKHLKKGATVHIKNTYRKPYAYIPVPYLVQDDPAYVLLEHYLTDHFTGNNSATLVYDPRTGFTGKANYTEWIDTEVTLEYQLPEKVWFNRIQVHINGRGGSLTVVPQVLINNGPVGPEHRQLEQDMAELLHKRITGQIKHHKARIDHVWDSISLQPQDKGFSRRLPIRLKKYLKRDLSVPLKEATKKPEPVEL